MKRLERGDKIALEDLEAESELTIGEFLRQDLLRFLKELGEEKLKRIPSGVGTAKKGTGRARGFFVAFRNPITNYHHWIFYDEEKGKIVERRLEAIQHVRCEPSELPEILPEDFDPRPLIKKLRKYLWNRIRAAEIAPERLPLPQRQIVNWLHALPPSAERNRLLQYFEECVLAGPVLKELRRFWRSRSQWPPEEWLPRLLEFADSHPYPPSTQSKRKEALAPQSEEDLECIAWMKII